MDILSEILSSRVRADIFQLLFTERHLELHVRAIERRCSVTFNSIRQELKKLSRLDLITSRRDGNRLYYRANSTHPLYHVLLELVAKTVGFRAILEQVLTHPQIQLAVVFGSLARGEEVAASDLDLMIIGEIGLRELSTLLSGQEEQTGREINPHIYSKNEFRERRVAADHLISKILTGEKVFIIGTEDELKEL
ncbi:MAG: helix-turn-helix domain-containing protein [Deltaproteobacteria bacterium]|nr:helix-turn-helix domain-containing protein [Deltaproteobacteria bacterium]